MDVRGNTLRKDMGYSKNLPYSFAILNGLMYICVVFQKPYKLTHMVKHIVFFRLLDEAEGCTKLENAQKIKEGLENLVNLVPCLKKAEVGINIPNATKTDYDVCLLCEFDSFADVDAYQVHPEHVKVASFIAKVRCGRAAVDYEY